MEIIIIFLVITFLFLLSGFPVAFILSGISLLFALIGVTFGYFDYSFLMAFPNRLYGVMGNQNLLAVPLFIFMGLILEKTKIAENLIHDMNAMFNETDSGYAISVVVVGALMAASTGIVGASVVTLGLLTYPVLVKNGYSPSLASGTICASGTLGQVIPPSLVLILLADVLSSSYQQAQLNMGVFSPETITIADLFVGAILFSLVFRGLEGEEFIHKLLVELPNDKTLTLIIVLVIMFLLGFILDFIEITFIVIPLIGPALFTLGFDPLWLGILIALVLQTSFITPPFGFSLFYLRGVLPRDVKTIEIYKGIIPFLIIQVILMICVFTFPSLATFLPEMLLE